MGLSSGDAFGSDASNSVVLSVTDAEAGGDGSGIVGREAGARRGSPGRVRSSAVGFSGRC